MYSSLLDRIKKDFNIKAIAILLIKVIYT